MRTIIEDFKESSCHYLDQGEEKVRKSFDFLHEEDVWKKPNSALNSMGNLLLHLQGNISQYIISSLGKNPDTRQRDEEFQSNPGYSKKKLLEDFAGTVAKAKEIIRNCPEEELLRIRRVQGFELSGTAIVIHVTEHLSYHAGQIAFWTKFLKEKDLGFYKGTNLNKKNE
ncbi:DinB family protein [Zeaxanthinibacter enoshimensis]|uniref:DinB family protein n=1 Tax=Zeaxanthinibacter enoshimensis TaxID=392009 RepID=UPI0035690174